ncbi:MAG: TIGR04282 family arsenosugar biosynthesis glycosyltransferase [Oceanihabitans sp.]
MKNKNLIIIFTRNPELGKVKTRLAKTIGNIAALNIYNLLLEHTEKTIRNINSDKAVYYSESINNSDIWKNEIYQKHQQIGADLGERMLHAFQEAFQNKYKKIVIVGSDLIDLKEKHLLQAFQELEQNDIVIGPAKDGGYYLLGMKTLQPQVFKNKQWGTDAVFKDTMKDLKFLKTHLLEPLNDIDTFKDLQASSILNKIIELND